MASVPDQPASEPAPLTGAKLLLAAFSLALANFVVVLDTTIANVSVPHIAGGLAVSPTQGTWVITSYAVADAISVPLTGWLSSRFGSVRWFIISLCGFAVFSFLCGVSGTLGMLVTFRILQGLSGGPLMPLSQTLLLRIFPKNKAALGLGIWAMTTTSAPIVGPILGGLISDNWSWPWIFFINLPVVALCIFAVSRLIVPYETTVVKRRIDLGGLALLVLFVAAFQIMLDTGRENDWFGSPYIVVLAIVAVVGLAAFVIWELTTDDPIVDIRIFRHRGFTAGTLSISLAYGAFFASVVLMPLWLQQIVGYTATDSGYTVAWVGVFAVILSPFAARLIGKVDLRYTVCAAILWMAGVSLMRAGWTSSADYWTLSLPQLVQGIGMPFFFIGLTSIALSSVRPNETVSAAGLMSFTRTLSGAVGTALATTAWDNASRASRADLVPMLNNPGATISTLQQAGMSLEQARATLDRLVEVQASTLGMIQVFLIAGGAFVLSAILVWLAPRATNTTNVPTGH
ncbi:DHA2 family efflux MFS transporter permease subunit [Sphingomonas sp.]|uniref:DHA2 family efflux MFS transporter permease subunit n=1 Tax=Sphingomonas sp. TaxID=28214 RepID=UPI0025DED7C1|nr:DHA2 family efflux MFS transporter permease subunit [Sphingomonas sp.]